eukprot:9450318-Karenia_brevis.AAC.1
MPCPMHSWTSEFRKCLCGCRDQGLQVGRLERDGALTPLIKSKKRKGKWRAPTAQEVSRALTFPTRHTLKGPQRLRIAQLGNSIAPAMA